MDLPLKLEFLRDTMGIYDVLYRKGQIIDYHPWSFEWQNMSEPERVKKNIFVHCRGMGEFDVFRSGDVRRLP